MPRRVQLEVFELADLTDERVELGRSELEEARLAAYEEGYSAGWDDAVAAQDQEITRLRGELGRNLRDLSFTYHEAHNHVLTTLEPLLRDMVAKVLPGIAHATLPDIVLEHLMPIARELAGQPIEVVANPANRAAIENHLLAAAKFPLTFAEEPTLGEGQVHFRFGEEEVEIDLDGTIDVIAKAVASFFQVKKDEVKAHG